MLELVLFAMRPKGEGWLDGGLEIVSQNHAAYAVVLRDKDGSIETILDLSLRVAVVPEDKSINDPGLTKAKAVYIPVSTILSSGPLVGVASTLGNRFLGDTRRSI